MQRCLKVNEYFHKICDLTMDNLVYRKHLIVKRQKTTIKSTSNLTVIIRADKKNLTDLDVDPQAI